MNDGTCALERIADREMETPGLLARAPVQLVAPIDPDGTEGGPVAQAQSGRVTQVTELEVTDEGVDVAAVEKGAEGETAAQVDPHLGSAENEGVPPRGEELAVGPRLLGARGIHREAPGAIVPTLEEPLGKREEQRLALAQGAGEAEADGEGEGRAPGEPVVARRLQEALHEAASSEGPERELEVRAHELAPARLEGVVAGVVEHRGRGAGDRVVAELTVHLLDRYLDVVDPSLLEGEAADEAEVVGEVPGR